MTTYHIYNKAIYKVWTNKRPYFAHIYTDNGWIRTEYRQFLLQQPEVSGISIKDLFEQFKTERIIENIK